MANSSMLARPTITAPASSRRCTAVAVYGATYPSRMRDAQVSRCPATLRLSLSATGTPASGPGSSPAATLRSMSPARPRAASSKSSR